MYPMDRSHLVCFENVKAGRATRTHAVPLWIFGTVIWIAAWMGLSGAATAATLPGKDALPMKSKPGISVAPSQRPQAAQIMAPASKTTGTPNLVVEGVSWRPQLIKEGLPIHFDFRVRNTGNVAAPTSNAVVYRANVPLVTQVLPPLAAGATQNASAMIEALCGATVMIKADAPNQISESNETDNSWSMKLNCLQTGAGFAAPRMTAPATVAAAKALRNQAGGTGNSTNTPAQPTGCTPDLYVRRVEIDPPYPRAFQNYRIKIWAIQFYPDNLPEAPQSFISVRLPGHTTVIDSQNVRIGKSNSAEPDFQWTRSDTGAKNLEVYVRLDHLNTLHECNEGNNEFIYPYTVYAENEPMADLQFRGYVAYPAHNLVNRDVELSGELINKGNAESRPFWLEFDCDDDRDAGTKLTHRVRIPSIIPPAGGVVAFNTRMRWTTPGLKVCLARLDNDGEVIESNENNNEYIGVSVRVDNPPPVQ
jgi:hypothetical protein